MTRESPAAGNAEPVTQSDGQILTNMLRAGRQWLQQHSSEVNALNVFPVPDGDTGTNMLLTMNAALAEIEKVHEESVSTVAQAVAHGALMGARGNSGVILSQIFRGFSHGLDGKDRFSPMDCATAAQEAYDTALRGVIKPVDGTILTVMKEVARVAQERAPQSSDALRLLEEIVETAQETTKLTPEMLPVLKEAGVVDAGGQGLTYILEGALRHLQGQDMTLDVEEDTPVGLPTVPVPSHDGYGYDVQFLIHGQSMDVEEIRKTIDSMGESTLVVGDCSTVKVHVHVPDPGAPISYGVRQGTLNDILVENMDQQSLEFASGHSLGKIATEELTGIGIVCVVPGEGLTRICESMGAGATVPGGQTMNPSTQQLLDAINSVNADDVLVLPNNGNVILAAQQARDLAEKNVAVVCTKTIPQGIGALMAFNYQSDLESNAEQMLRSAEEIQTVEVTHAVRSTQIGGVQVNEGDIIGLFNDVLVATGSSFDEVTLEVLGKASAENYELSTIYFGQDSSQDNAEQLADQISKAYPDLDVDIYDGGQAHYHYILSLE